MFTGRFFSKYIFFIIELNRERGWIGFEFFNNIKKNSLIDRIRCSNVHPLRLGVNFSEKRTGKRRSSASLFISTSNGNCILEFFDLGIEALLGETH